MPQSKNSNKNNLGLEDSSPQGIAMYCTSEFSVGHVLFNNGREILALHDFKSIRMEKPEESAEFTGREEMSVLPYCGFPASYYGQV
ncbi:hypothetical protein Tco_0482486 [Tanacetum coccineum]